MRKTILLAGAAVLATTAAAQAQVTVSSTMAATVEILAANEPAIRIGQVLDFGTVSLLAGAGSAAGDIAVNPLGVASGDGTCFGNPTGAALGQVVLDGDGLSTLNSLTATFPTTATNGLTIGISVDGTPVASSGDDIISSISANTSDVSGSDDTGADPNDGVGFSVSGRLDAADCSAVTAGTATFNIVFEGVFQ